jgi:hypothetical protein
MTEPAPVKRVQDGQHALAGAQGRGRAGKLVGGWGCARGGVRVLGASD